MPENTPKPIARHATPRSTGSHLVPERAKPRSSGEPPTYPKGHVPMPGQRVKPGPSGDSQSNTMKTNRVTPVVTRMGGGAGKPAGSTKTVTKRRGGSDKSKI